MLGDFGEIYVLDWGLAKVIGADQGATPLAGRSPASLPDETPDNVETDVDEVGRTVAGAILGTPGYAAPEVLQGKPADARADVYALGAILFEILAGGPLCPGERAHEMIARTIDGLDARPSVRAPDREIAPELEALCVRATALDPAARPSSARELHDEVEQFLDGDRDQELRRSKSHAHATAARASAESALGHGTLADRERALGEVGRALALDPENRDAAETLIALLTTPPREVPPEAQAALARGVETRLQTAARIGSAVYLSSILFVPLVIAVGVLSWPLLLGVSGAFVLTAALAFALSTRRPSPFIVLFLMVVSTAAVSSTSLLWGAYVLLPTMITFNTMAYVEHEEIVPAWVMVLVGSMGLIVPVALSWLGVLPACYDFREGVIQILPRAMRFRGGAGGSTEWLLFGMNLATVLFASIYAVHFHRARAGADRALQLQAWQLRKLVSR
jgi:serine/threonine-protein kinase